MPAMLPATLLFRGAVYKLAQPPTTEHHEHEHPTHISLPVSARPYNPAANLHAFGFTARLHGLGLTDPSEAVHNIRTFHPKMTPEQHQAHRDYHRQQARHFAKEAEIIESMIRSNAPHVVKPHLKGLRRAQQSFRELTSHHWAFYKAHNHLMEQPASPPPAPAVNYFGTD